MTDLKHLRAYPAYLHLEPHRRHDTLGMVAAIALGLCVAAGTAGYVAGRHMAQIDASAAADEIQPMVTACDPPDHVTDVIEHTFAIRGRVFHRECIAVSRPSYVAPRYSVQTPAHPPR